MKMLLVTTAWPWPSRRGLQARALDIAEILADEHELTILAPEPSPAAGTVPASSPFAVSTYKSSAAAVPLRLLRAAFSRRALQSALADGRELRDKALALAGEADGVVLQTTRLAALLPLLDPGRTIVDFIDCLSLNFRNRSRLDRFWSRPLWRFEASRLEKDERNALRTAAACAVVSERDRLHLERNGDSSGADRLGVVPLVLREARARKPGEARGPRPPVRLLATGNAGYFPTRRGLGWFLDEVWPGVRETVPGAQFTLAGSRIPAGLERQIRSAGGSVVRDPEQLESAFDAADLAIAPLFGGSGTAMKLLEAIGAGAPAIASPDAVAGLDPRLAPAIACAATADDWIGAIRRFAEERDVWTERAREAQRLAWSIHSPAAVRADWNRLWAAAGIAPRSSRAAPDAGR